MTRRHDGIVPACLSTVGLCLAAVAVMAAVVRCAVPL